MLEPYKKLAAILRTTPEVLYELDGKMSKITGQDGVMESIANQNDALVSKTLAELSLTRNATAEELLDKEGFSSVVSALRFTQNKDWMHKFFDVAYNELKPEDFEERDVELKVLETKWLAVAEKFLEKKYHNISHLKEYGVIFVIPLPIDTAGETMRMFTLIMHYLHEVPFYSDLFRKFMKDSDFIDKFKSLLRGDVSDKKIESDKPVWRVVQTYLSKDNEQDFRLFEPHVNPEAEHWLKVSEDLGRLSRMLPGDGNKVDLGYWTGLDYVGDFFPSTSSGQAELVSFDLTDLIMSLVKKGQ